LRPGQVVVISPLISLMQDQVMTLNRTVGTAYGRDVAVYLGSAQTDRSAEGRAYAGEYLLVYASPEKLLGSGMLDAMAGLRRQGRLALVAVDEAHCVSQWGHDFRPEYFKLGAIRRAIPDVPLMALTATAVPRVQQDIVQSLCMHQSGPA
jgi:ATP-dependent DNA helicase RecQ